jgi:hypothetical protein
MGFIRTPLYTRINKIHPTRSALGMVITVLHLLNLAQLQVYRLLKECTPNRAHAMAIMDDSRRVSIILGE